MDHTEEGVPGVQAEIEPADNENCMEEDKEKESRIAIFEEEIREFLTNFNKYPCAALKEDNEVKAVELVGNKKNKIEVLPSATKDVQNQTFRKELKRVNLEFPMEDATAPCQHFPQKNVREQVSSTGFTQKPKKGAFIDEVKRVLYNENTANFPENGTPDYYDVAQEYAVYGNDFFDFPQDFETISKQSKLKKKTAADLDMTPSSSEEKIFKLRGKESLTSLASSSMGATASETGILESKPAEGPGGNSNCETLNRSGSNEIPCLEQAYHNANSTTLRPILSNRPTSSNKPLSAAASAGAATAATYYQLCANFQPAFRPVNAVNTNAAAAAAAAVVVNAANSAYSMRLNSANSTYRIPPQQIFYNQQHFSTTTNVFSNQVAIGNPSNIRFPSPFVATTTIQQISNTVFKETQYLANVPVASAAGNVNVFVMQQKTYQTWQQKQQHQQAIFAAAMHHRTLQRQQHQMRVAARVQSTGMTVAENVAYVGGYNNVMAMAPRDPVNTPNRNAYVSRGFPNTGLNNRNMETSSNFRGHV